MNIISEWNPPSRKLAVVLIRAFLVGGFLLYVASAIAQTATPVQGDATSLTEANVDWSSVSDLEVMLLAVESVQPAPASSASRFGTFYSAQHAPGTRNAWPPLPSNARRVPVWNLGDGVYLIDDRQVNYAALDAAAATTATTMTMSAKAKPMGGGFSPDDLTGGLPFLIIAPTGTNQFLITITNAVSGNTYDIYTTPVLGDTVNYPWTAAAIGASGQTNFTVNMGPYSTGFFRAVVDTNGIPLWEAADPNNPGAGILAVFIDSPANGGNLTQ
jgi:hypothetical protein